MTLRIPPDAIVALIDDKEPKRKTHHFGMEACDMDLLRRENANGYGVFVTANSFSGERRVAENLTRLCAVYADLDVAKSGDGMPDEERERKKTELHEALLAKLPPSITVETRNGIQPRWYVDVPNPSKDDVATYEHIIKGVVDYGLQHGAIGDDVHDVARVLRMPGFDHMKEAPYRCKEIPGTDKVHTLEELRAAYWREPAKKTVEPSLLRNEDTSFSAMTEVKTDVLSRIDSIPWSEVLDRVGGAISHTIEIGPDRHFIFDGERRGTFLSEDGTYVAHSEDAGGTVGCKGNRTTVVEGLFRKFAGRDMAKGEAVRWLCTEFGIERNDVPYAGIKKDEPLALPLLALLSSEFPEKPWVIDRLFNQGTVNLISAAPGMGKTWTILHMAAEIARGEKVFGEFETTQQGVLMVLEDDAARSVQKRLKMLLGDVADLPVFFVIEQGLKVHPQPAKEDDDVSRLLEVMRKHDLKTVFIDMLYSVQTGDENAVQDMAAIFDQFKRFVRDGRTVVLTHHHRKRSREGRDDVSEQLRGSSAIGGALQGHIVLESVVEGGQKFLNFQQAKLKEGKIVEPFRVKFEEDGDRIRLIYAGKRPEDVGEGAEAVKQARQKIMEMLRAQNKWMGKKDFVALGAGKTTTVKQATYEMRVEGLLSEDDRPNLARIGSPLYTPDGARNEKLYCLAASELAASQLEGL